jgi:WD40 repeat protein
MLDQQHLTTRAARRCLFLASLLTAVALLTFHAIAAEDDPAIQRFREQASKSSTAKERLRKEVLDFITENPGTPAATQAAGILAQLPSPLDKLDASRIPALDRFDWQPKELVAVLGEHRGRQGHVVSGVAWCRTGKLIASSGHNGYVRLWDPQTLRQTARVSTGSAATCVALSRDQKWLAAGQVHGHLFVWDLTKKVPALAGHFPIATSPIYGIDINPAGTMLAAGTYDGIVHLYDLADGKAKHRVDLSGHKTGVRAVRFSPTGRSLASGSSDGIVRFWGLGKNGVLELAQIEGHVKGVTALDYSPSGSTLAVGTADGQVWFWSVTTRPRRRGLPLVAHKGEIRDLTFDARGANLATASTDGTAKVWDTTRLRTRWVIDGHSGAVHGVSFAPDGRSLVTGGGDWTVRIWGLTGVRPTEKFPLKGHWSMVNDLVFTPGGRSLSTGSEDRSARVWDLTQAAPDQTAQFPCDAPVNALAFGPDGKTLATGTNSTTVTLWDFVSRRKLRTLPGHPTSVSMLAYLPDSKRLLASSGKTLVLWNADNGREMSRFDMHQQRINSFSLSGDGRYVLTGTGYYDYDEKGKIKTKDGQYVYADCTLRLLDVKDGSLVKEVKDLKYPVSSVAFAPDSRQAVASLWRSNTHLWDVSTEAIKDQGEMKTGCTWAHLHVFSPDGRVLATKGQEGRLVLFDRITGKVIWQWVPEEAIRSICFSPGGRYLAVALITGPVYILRLTPPAKVTR